MLPASYEPRATGHIPEMVALVGQLVDRGHAYVAPDGSGDVYFDVGSWPAYGELSHQRLADMEPAADADPRGKRDPRDFALWKGAKPGEPATASWSTPWGAGRPGWHLECSAMARRYLGPAFDIHGGGLDLRFPHHENEQAQSRAAGDAFTAWWLHNGWVTMSGEKMSKSLGNGLLVSQVLTEVRAVELRYYLGSAHYRSSMEFSDRSLGEAAAAWRRIEGFLGRATGALAGDGGAVEVVLGDVPRAFAAALDDDLSVPAALAVVHETVREGNRLLAAGLEQFALAAANDVTAMVRVLGIDPLDPHWSAGGSRGEAAAATALDALVQAQLEVRAQARARKDFAASDAVRDALAAAGVLVQDGADGARWSLADRPAD